MPVLQRHSTHLLSFIPIHRERAIHLKIGKLAALFLAPHAQKCPFIQEYQRTFLQRGMARKFNQHLDPIFAQDAEPAEWQISYTEAE